MNAMVRYLTASRMTIIEKNILIMILLKAESGQTPCDLAVLLLPEVLSKVQEN